MSKENSEQKETKTTGKLSPGDESVVLPRSLRLRCLWPGVAAMLLAVALIPFAEPIYWWIAIRIDEWPVEKFLNAAKLWPNIFVLLGIVIAIWRLDPKKRKYIIILPVAFAVSSLANETIKQVTGRARPHYGIDMQTEFAKRIEHYQQKNPEARMSIENGDQWLWLSPQRPWFWDGFSSFPSGHANSAFVQAAYLSALYPGLRVVFYAFAGGCAASRVEDGRHHLEDVIFGGALAWLLTQWVLSWAWPVRLGRRFFESG